MNRSIIAFALMLLVAGSSVAGGYEEVYVELLKRHRIESDSDSLLAYLRRVRPSESTDALAIKLIDDLSNSDFYIRENAESRLLSLPVVPMARLVKASKGSDPEVRFRAARVILKFKDGARESIMNAVLRVIRHRVVPGAAEELLLTMRTLGEHSLRQTASDALRATATKADAERLRRAIESSEFPWLRAAAVEAFSRAHGSAGSDEVAKRLGDRMIEVRFAAARALARLADRRAIDPYIALLSSDDPSTRARAARDLRRLTDQRFEFGGYRKPAERDAAVKRWADWASSAAGKSAKLTALEDVRIEFLGRILVCEYTKARVVEYDLDGNKIWEQAGLKRPFAGKGTPEGHRLISTYPANVIIEYDAAGKEVFRSKKMPGFVSGLSRLENGNTLVACGNNKLILELDSAGKEIWRASLPDNSMEATRLSNGRTLVALQTQGAVEIDRGGKIVWRLKPGRGAYAAQRLDDGTTVLAHHSKSVAAYSRDGKRLWEITALSGLYRAQQLPDGRIVLADSKGVRIVDTRGRVLKTITTTGGTLYISAY